MIIFPDALKLLCHKHGPPQIALEEIDAFCFMPATKWRCICGEGRTLNVMFSHLERLCLKTAIKRLHSSKAEIPLKGCGWENKMSWQPVV